MSSAIQRVLALCDEWDVLSRGSTATTRRIREAIRLGNQDDEAQIQELLANPRRWKMTADSNQPTLFGELCD